MTYPLGDEKRRIGKQKPSEYWYGLPRKHKIGRLDQYLLDFKILTSNELANNLVSFSLIELERAD